MVTLTTGQRVPHSDSYVKEGGEYNEDDFVICIQESTGYDGMFFAKDIAGIEEISQIVE